MITPLQFADDTLIFGAAKENEVKNVIVVLRCYEVVSGLKVNVYKSSLIRVVVDPLITHLLADVMGCRVGSIPRTYLGLPLSWGSVPKSLWNPVVESRIQTRVLEG